MKVMIVRKLLILSSKFDSEKVKNSFLPIKINQVGSEAKDHDLIASMLPSSGPAGAHRFSKKDQQVNVDSNNR